MFDNFHVQVFRYAMNFVEMTFQKLPKQPEFNRLKSCESHVIVLSNCIWNNTCIFLKSGELHAKEAEQNLQLIYSHN